MGHVKLKIPEFVLLILGGHPFMGPVLRIHNFIIGQMVLLLCLQLCYSNQNMKDNNKLDSD